MADKNIQLKENTGTSPANLFPVTKLANVKLTDGTGLNVFSGSDGTGDGKMGLVPAPVAADAGKFLNGDGSWTALPSRAGASTDGGSATSAVKLDTSTAGSATQPSYFSGGKPVACTYSLNKTVPADAKFTDTTYSNATPSAAGLMSAADKTQLNKVTDAKISAWDNAASLNLTYTVVT